MITTIKNKLKTWRKRRQADAFDADWKAHAMIGSWLDVRNGPWTTWANALETSPEIMRRLVSTREQTSQRIAGQITDIPDGVYRVWDGWVVYRSFTAGRYGSEYKCHWLFPNRQQAEKLHHDLEQQEVSSENLHKWCSNRWPNMSEV